MFVLKKTKQIKRKNRKQKSTRNSYQGSPSSIFMINDCFHQITSKMNTISTLRTRNFKVMFTTSIELNFFSVFPPSGNIQDSIELHFS